MYNIERICGRRSYQVSNEEDLQFPQGITIRRICSIKMALQKMIQNPMPKVDEKPLGRWTPYWRIHRSQQLVKEEYGYLYVHRGEYIAAWEWYLGPCKKRKKTKDRLKSKREVVEMDFWQRSGTIRSRVHQIRSRRVRRIMEVKGGPSCSTRVISGSSQKKDRSKSKRDIEMDFWHRSGTMLSRVQRIRSRRVRSITEVKSDGIS